MDQQMKILDWTLKKVKKVKSEKSNEWGLNASWFWTGLKRKSRKSYEWGLNYVNHVCVFLEEYISKVYGMEWLHFLCLVLHCLSVTAISYMIYYIEGHHLP